MVMKERAQQLIEQITEALRRENISTGELVLLEGLVDEFEIPPDRIDLLEAGGLPEEKLDWYTNEFLARKK